MCDRAYDDIPITTITTVAKLYGEISIEVLFFLIPITYLNIDSLNHKTIPKCNVYGAILSAIYENQKRGFPKKSRCFKNAVMLELSMGNKNVSLRVSHSNIQMVGATSIEMAQAAVKIILLYVQFIQNKLNRMHEDEERTQKTIEWILDNTKSVRRFQNELVEFVFPPDGYHAREAFDFPEGVDEELARWFIPMMSDFSLHSDFERYLQFIQTLHYVQLKPWEKPPTFSYHMINRNFTIPFQIHRRRLYQLFRSLPNWISIYDSSFSPSVRIRRKSREKKVKNTARGEVLKDCYHSFIIFSTGSVTQSGTNLEEAREFFYELNKIISDNRDLVELKTRRRNIDREKIEMKKQNFAYPYCLSNLEEQMSEDFLYTTSETEGD